MVVIAGTARPRPLDSGYVRDLIHLARELPDVRGEAPRLYVVTRNAQSVFDDDEVDLAHAGLRGLLRVIGAEHPYLRATHIDVDEQSSAESVALPIAVEAQRRMRPPGATTNG